MVAESAEAQPAAAKRSPWKIAVISAVQLACVAFVAYTLWKDRHELTAAFRLTLSAVLGLVALMLLGHIQRTFEFTYMLRRLGVREPFADGFWLTGAGFLLNHLPLNMGFVMRAVVLRRDHALPYSAYASLTLVNIVTSIAVAASVGLTGVVIGSGGSRPLNLPVFLGLAGLIVGSVLVLWMPVVPPSAGNGFVWRQLRNLAAGVALIRGNGSALFVLVLISLTKVIALGFRLGICFHVLGHSIPAFDLALLAGVQNLMALVNVTPGNLGLREMAVALMTGQTGVSQAIGMAAASIDRVVSIAYMVATGLPGISKLRNRGPLAARE
jgi:uncharacterized membrane protein YbhN (UPF0104 family)